MESTRGTILVLPGGGYRVHAPHEAEPIAEWLKTLGWRTRVVRYPLEARHPRPLAAAREAIAVARATGTGPVGVIGFSAGGHLAGHAALSPDSAPVERPDFAILGYAVTSMLTHPHPGSRDVLAADDDHIAAAISLERMVRPDAPPMFIWHTVADQSVRVSHAYGLAQALAAAGAPHELHTFPGDVHGLGLAADTAAAAWTGLCAEWLLRWDAQITSK